MGSTVIDKDREIVYLVTRITAVVGLGADTPSSGSGRGPGGSRTEQEARSWGGVARGNRDALRPCQPRHTVLRVWPGSASISPWLQHGLSEQAGQRTVLVPSDVFPFLEGSQGVTGTGSSSWRREEAGAGAGPGEGLGILGRSRSEARPWGPGKDVAQGQLLSQSGVTGKISSRTASVSVCSGCYDKMHVDWMVDKQQKLHASGFWSPRTRAPV